MQRIFKYCDIQNTSFTPDKQQKILIYRTLSTSYRNRPTLNKKLRYLEEHSASVVLSWCSFMTFIGDKQQINS